MYLLATKARTPAVSLQDAHAQIRDTLEYVMASAIPAQHKSVLIEALTQALRKQADVDEHEQCVRQAGAPWQAEEVVQLRTCLEGQVARSWRHADELAMRLALQLKRSIGDVRAKAKELGLDAAIHYRRGSVAESGETEWCPHQFSVQHALATGRDAVREVPNGSTQEVRNTAVVINRHGIAIRTWLS